MAQWSWQVTGLDLIPRGEIANAKAMKVSLPLNKVGTASFTIKLSNPLVPEIMTNLGYLKVFRNNILIFFGPIITAQEVGEGDIETATVQVNASGPEWILSQLLAAKTELEADQKTSTEEFAAIFKKYVEAVEAAGTETHIDFKSGSISGGEKYGYETPLYRPISEILNDMVNTTGGLDWRVTPVDNYLNGVVTTTKLGRFEAGSALGQTRPEAIFEWGVGLHNGTSYSRTVDRSTLLNKAYHILSTGPFAEVNGLVTSGEANAEVAAEMKSSQEKWGLQEGVISASLVNLPLRQALVDEHVKIRSRPRQTINFQPNSLPATPSLGREFSVGDRVFVKIGFEEQVRYEAEVRVWGVEFNLDENLKEQQILTLSDS